MISCMQSNFITAFIHLHEDCIRLQYDIDILLQWSKKWLLSVAKVLHISNSSYAGDYKLVHIYLELLDNIYACMHA